MSVVHRSPTSIRDYQKIWTYLADQDLQKEADALLAEFETKLKLLSEHPYVGAARPDLRKDLRHFPVGSYLLFYKPKRDGILLARALHSSRDLRKSFKR